MNATMDHDKFVGGIREAVREALAEKEEANRLEKVEELLQTAEDTINELTSTINKKDSELAASTEAQEDLKAKLEELQTKHAELEEKLAAAGNTTQELEERASKAEKELADIAADRQLELRMAELEEAKVSSTDDERRKAQADRIRGMSDEEFAAYKQELVELRSRLEAELVKTNTEEASKEEVEDEGGEGVAPADLEKARKEQAAAAAAATLNIEVASEDIKSKYAKLGMAMAERLKNSRE